MISGIIQVLKDSFGVLMLVIQAAIAALAVPKEKRKLAGGFVFASFLLVVVYYADFTFLVREGYISPKRYYNAESLVLDGSEHYYKAFDESISWTEARAECKRKGGHLATVTSKQEQKFIANICKSQDKYFYWLGGYNYSDDSEAFEWVTGEEWVFNDPWLQGQPDNFNGQTEKEGFQHYLSYEPYQDGWDDKELKGDIYGDNSVDDDRAGYVCEWDDKKDISYHN